MTGDSEERNLDAGRPPAGAEQHSHSALGLYLHIPFCAAICNYCNFNRGLLDEAVKRQYVTALRSELLAAPERGRLADTIFFGGGTPSLLDGAEVAAILDACRSAFDIAPDAEITLEANPETVSAESLASYREAGVNRLSFGVQSFRDEELARLGRLHSADTARRAVAAARRAGFEDISLDLMLWLPGQSVEAWLESVDALIDVGPSHASLYLLEVYPNAPLRDEMARGGWSVAPDEDAAEMYLQGLARLDRAGFEQYEISNLARPGRRSRHNLKYWRAGSWLGAGCGAHSTVDSVRWRNVAGTAEYIGRIGARQSPRLDVRTLSDEERMEEALFMGLRLSEGLGLSEMHQRYGCDVWERYGAELLPFVDAGWLVRQPDRIALTRPGMLVANEIMMVFIGRAVR